jgi:shikimate dehydrogenase
MGSLQSIYLELNAISRSRRAIDLDQVRLCESRLLVLRAESAYGKQMNQTFKAACVIGWPVAHSRSPLIHNYWIRRHGLDAEYRREAVPPERFAQFIGELAARGYVGASVTLPHKEEALRLSKPDALAAAVGAANMLWLEDGTLCSSNTDVEGFIDNLDATVPGWDAKLDSAVVLGAGGAARSVVFALRERKLRQIHVVNRSFDRALLLRDRFGPAVLPQRWDAIAALLPDAGLLVNTTTLGMTGQPPLAIDLAPVSARAVVADIIYAPLTTPLLAAASARGLKTVDGLGMLLRQAVRAFARWFGVRPQVTGDLRALVEADLMRP